MPTDGGFGRAAEGAGRFAAAAHQTAAVPASVAAARASAVRNHFQRREVFNRDWYHHHPHCWNPRHWSPNHAWAWATWPQVEVWFSWGNDLPPVYYDYGNLVVYQGDEVYYGNRPMATAAEYYRQAAALAASGAATDANAGSWMPLGVFAFVLGDPPDTSRVVQLAVNKSRTIAGNYYDALTGVVLPVHGGHGPDDSARRLDGRRQQDDRVRNGPLQLDDGPIAHAGAPRQRADAAMDAGSPSGRGPRGQPLAVPPSAAGREELRGT